jgi:hypothetical protein
MPDLRAAEVMARELSARNSFVHGIDTVSVNLFQKPASSNPDYVWVKVAKKVPVFFMRVLGFNTFNVSAESAAMKFNWIPVHISEGIGIYGVTGVHFLNCFGYNRRKTISDPHSSKWNDDGSLNPDYNEKGFDYVLDVPDDYAANNNTSIIKVEIFDADCWNSDDNVKIQDLSPRKCIDEINLKEDKVDGNLLYYSDGHPPSGSGRTITTFEIFSPNDNLNPMASYTWDESKDPQITNLKWFCPAGFQFDTAAMGGPGKYRINVKAGEGTSRNVYHLRSGPPLSNPSSTSEMAVATGYFRPEDHVITMEFTYTKLNDPNDMLINIGDHTFQNGDLGIVAGGGSAQTATIDITNYVDSANMPFKFSNFGDADNGIKNVKIYVDGVLMSDTPEIALGVPVDSTLVKIDPSVAKTYTLEWDAFSWDEPMEVSVIFNGNDLNWEDTQGTTAKLGGKHYSFDVTNYITGDSGFVSLKNNNHTPPDSPVSTHKPAEIKNLVLKRSDGYVHTFLDGTDHIIGGLPEIYYYNGLGSDAGWGPNTQFDPFNGSSISSLDQLFLTEFNRNSGQVNSTLGYLPPEIAGTDVHILGVGIYSGTRWLDYYDSTGYDWSVIKPETENKIVKTADITISDDHTESVLYTNYAAGAEGRSTWYLGITASNIDTPKSKVRLVE